MSVASLSSLPVWRDEQLLFRREKGAGCYGSGSYFVSVVLLDFIPMRVVPPCVFAFSYKMIGLQDSSPSHLAVFLFVLILTNCTITSATMAIGALSPAPRGAEWSVRGAVSPGRCEALGDAAPARLVLTP